MDIDVKGEIYEGLLQKNAEDTKTGAGQYFTPRPLIKAIVEVMRPAPNETICDPACGTGGFLLAAHDYISKNYALDKDQKKFLKFDALRGWEIVDNVARLCVMNLYLHGIGSEESPITVGDTLISDPGIRFDKVLTNPPFGRKSSITIVNEGGQYDKETVIYERQEIKPIVCTMVSSGIRIGAWDYLQWKHVIPMANSSGETVAAKLIVYAGDREEYYTFVTPEAYNSLKEWMDFRASYGEKITGESWLMRDIWQTTNVDYGAKWGLATNPKKLKSSGIKRLLERSLWEQGIRQPLKDGEKRHEWKAAHGFRKFYKSHAEQVMRPINVEITMGHNIGLSASYYKPKEKEVLEDYIKAVNLLTISNDNVILQKEVAELQQKSKDNEYIIRGKLQEKDEEMKTMKEQFSTMQSQLQTLISTLGSIKDQNQVNQTAQMLYKSGILATERT